MTEPDPPAAPMPGAAMLVTPGGATPGPDQAGPDPLPPDIPPPPIPAPPRETAGVRPGRSYSGMATGSLVCAIVGVFIFQPLLGAVAIGLGAVARWKMRGSKNFDGYGRALAGIIIGAIVLAITVAVIVSVMLLLHHPHFRAPGNFYRVGTGFSPR